MKYIVCSLLVVFLCACGNINYKLFFCQKIVGFVIFRYKVNDEHILELAELGTYKDTLVQNKWQSAKKMRRIRYYLREELEKLKVVK